MHTTLSFSLSIAAIRRYRPPMDDRVQESSKTTNDENMKDKNNQKINDLFKT